MIPGPYAAYVISFENPDSDAAMYRVVRFGRDTAEQALRELDEFKKPE